MAKIDNDNEENKPSEVNEVNVSVLDIFDFAIYFILAFALVLVLNFGYTFGRCHGFDLPFSVMDFSSSTNLPLFGAFIIVVLESLLFKTYVKNKDKLDGTENIKNMENFLAGLSSMTIGVCLVFSIIDLIKNGAFATEVIIGVVLYSVCMFFYFKSEKTISNSNYLCSALVGIMVFTFFVMGMLSTKIEEVNMAKIDGDTYRIVQTGEDKTLLVGFDRYTKSLTGKYMIYYNDTGKYLHLSNLK